MEQSVLSSPESGQDIQEQFNQLLVEFQVTPDAGALNTQRPMHEADKAFAPLAGGVVLRGVVLSVVLPGQ